MKRELLVNPLLISTPPLERIEYVLYANGRRRIYVVKDTTGDINIPGTVSTVGYRPNGEIIYQTPDNISSKDEQLWKISRELAERYRFRFDFLKSDFRNAMVYLFRQIPDLDKVFPPIYQATRDTKKQPTKARGCVGYYGYGYARKVKFGPVVKIFTKMERMNDVRAFTTEFKLMMQELYGKANIFLTHENGYAILREL